MSMNKIITRKNGVDTVLLDVSGTTATEEKVLKGEVFTKADGTVSTGTLEQSEGYQMSLSDDGTEINFVWGGAKNEVTLTITTQNEHAYPLGQLTYVSLTKPTSEVDYDYDSNMRSDASVSIPSGTVVYVWGYGCQINDDYMGIALGDTYDEAAEVIITEDTTLTIKYTVGGGGSGD